MFKGESREPCIAHAKAPEYPAGKQTRQARRMRSRTCSLSTPRVSSLLSQTLMHLGRNERTISRVPIMKAVPKFLSFPFGFFTNSDWIHGAFRIHVWRNAVFRSSSGGPRLLPGMAGLCNRTRVPKVESCWPSLVGQFVEMGPCGSREHSFLTFQTSSTSALFPFLFSG